jgi:cytochrome P450
MDKGSAMTAAETEVADVRVPLRQGYDHESEPTLLREHHAEWDRLREETPVFRSDIAPAWNLWYLLRYEDAHGALQQPDLFSSRHVAPYTHEDPHQWIPLELDPPAHTKYRHVLNVKFSPTAVAAMEPAVRAQAAALVSAIEPTGACDLIAEFARRYPTTIFMKLMGLPLDEADTFLDWVDELMHTSNADDADGSVRARAAETIYGYLGALIADRRHRPRDDLVSYLTASSIDGRPMTDAELLEMSFLLYMAGLDTVAGMIGYSFRHLADHPDHRQVLVEHPESVAGAVEELLRFYGIVTTVRVATRDTEFAGCPMKANDRVVIPYAAANRDPREFANADRFQLDRFPNRHIAFGAGAHRCLGSHLARLELRVAIEEWHARIPDYRIADGAELRQHIGGVAGLERLPLRWA